MPDLPDELVIFDVVDGVGHVRMNSPQTSNALDIPMARALKQAFTAAAAHPEVRAVLITGAGPRFCAGGDVKGMAAAPDPAAFIAELVGLAHEAITAVVDLEVPVVAAVQGSAAGAGLSLALVADLVVAAESARFVTAYQGVGLTPDCGMSWTLPLAVGQRRARELLLTGRILTAREALDWGLVTSTCPDEALTDAALGVAAKLAAGPSPALGLTRRLLTEGPERTLREHLDAEALAITKSVVSADAQARIAAFTRPRRA
jgi:2-(1,2-epoxy-1,2-dihydrophenyl)acetyl-CoA isomerase